MLFFHSAHLFIVAETNSVQSQTLKPPFDRERKVEGKIYICFKNFFVKVLPNCFASFENLLDFVNLFSACFGLGEK